MEKARKLIAALLRKAEDAKRENRVFDLSAHLVAHNGGKSTGLHVAAQLIADSYGISKRELEEAVNKAREDSLQRSIEMSKFS